MLDSERRALCPEQAGSWLAGWGEECMPSPDRSSILAVGVPLVEDQEVRLIHHKSREKMK